MNEIASLITTIGFPCVCCIGMGMFCKELVTTTLETVNKSMNETSVAITHLADVIEELQEDIRNE